jgi:hypothetical protein
MERRLLVKFLSLVIVPIVLTAIACNFIAANQMHKTLDDRLIDSFEGVLYEIKDISENLLVGAKAIGSEQEFKEAFIKKDEQTLLEILENAKNILNIDQALAVDINGKILASGNNPASSELRFSDLDIIVNANAEKTTVGMKRFPSGLSLSVSLPVKSKDHVVGFLIFSRLLDYKLLKHLEKQFHLKISVYNGQRLQATTFSNPEIIEKSGFRPFTESYLKGKGVVKFVRIANTPYIVMCKPLFSGKPEQIGILLMFISCKSTEYVLNSMSIIFIGVMLFIHYGNHLYLPQSGKKHSHANKNPFHGGQKSQQWQSGPGTPNPPSGRR